MQEIQRKYAITEKVGRIIDRILADITDETKEEWVRRDCRYNNLGVDLRKAKKKNKLTSVAIIERQMEAQRHNVLLEHAEEIVKAILCNRRLGFYLDDEDKERYENLTALFFLLYDALDTALNDMTGFVNSLGIQGQFQISKAIEAARNDIALFHKEATCFSGTPFEEIILDDSDRVYNYALQRIPVLFRKLQRKYDSEILKKQKAQKKK